MKKTLAISLTALLGLTAFGTEQYHDEITYSGANYYLSNYYQMYPMERYFIKHPDRFKQYKYGMSTALSRGHIAVLEVRDNQLYLKDIKVLAEREERNGEWYIKGTDILSSKASKENRFRSALHEVFPNQKTIKMDWVTGLLAFSEHYLRPITVLAFDKGNVTKTKKFDGQREYEAFMDRQLEAFKKTDEYETTKAELQKIQSKYAIEWRLRSAIPKMFVD